MAHRSTVHYRATSSWRNPAWRAVRRTERKHTSNLRLSHTECQSRDRPGRTSSARCVCQLHPGGTAERQREEEHGFTDCPLLYRTNWTDMGAVLGAFTFAGWVSELRGRATRWRHGQATGNIARQLSTRSSPVWTARSAKLHSNIWRLKSYSSAPRCWARRGNKT